MGKLADAIREGCAMPDQKRAQLLSLDAQFEQVTAERDALKKENLNLKAQVNPLEREVKQLKEEKQRILEQASKHGDLDSDTERVLIAIVESDGRMPRRGTAKALGFSNAKGEYCFDLLEERDYILNISVDQRTGEPLYCAEPEGRKYLAARGKLK